MTGVVPRSSDTPLVVAGALVATSGLAAAAALSGPAGAPVLMPLADVGLAVGVAILALGGSGIVGSARPARLALLLFGCGPLIHRLAPAPTPWSVLVGTSTIWAITIATAASAVLVVRARRLRGVGRWALLVVAVDALLVALMSTVPLGDLARLYLEAHLGLVRPLALLAWGIALVLQSAAVRRAGAAAVASWQRTTDVGASEPMDRAAPMPDAADPRIRAEQG